MAMFDTRPLELRFPVRHPQPPVLEPGDRVRLRRVPGTMPGHRALAGAKGTVEAVHGNRVIVRMDEPYQADCVEQRLFYSYPFELEKIERVGRMGDEDLFADEEEEPEPGA
ncbi:MAG: hypothetical protein ACXVYV_06695 [Gaiellales bacterium]